ncbi:MAG TPA: tetratricopeptide repeat protein [Fimbriimonadaceae bacterium]|nr:tetratricopeptide repeat protein [Fimbriimonadaceae bacterium]HRJ96047.1 tetratricopeptide repeat protein [Fimbriimonadaceae bacterium]
MVALGHVCDEADCPLAEEPETGPESKVYPELAKANVLRMRGEYKLARDTCLSLLKRYPGNVDAHTLLGDIEAEEGDLVHAAQWYEMALDLRPESEADARKLEAIRQRIQDREARQTAQQLGLPTTKPRAMLFAAVAIVVVLASVSTAFLLGNRMRESNPTKREVITTPIQAGTPEENVASISAPENKTEITPPAPTPTPIPESATLPTTEDASLLARLRTEAIEGARLTAAEQDPRDKSIEITARADQVGDLRELAALLGVSILDRASESRKVTIRLTDQGALVLVADVPREAVDGAREAIGDLGAGRYNKEALIGVLTDVWPTQ